MSMKKRNISIWKQRRTVRASYWQAYINEVVYIRNVIFRIVAILGKYLIVDLVLTNTSDKISKVFTKKK